MIYYRKGQLCRDQVNLDLAQPAFRTGYGFFETIAWNGRKICHLDLHIKRARKSLADFKIDEVGFDYGKIIHDVIDANKLRGRFARVNIFFPVEKGKTSPLVCVAPFEYDPNRIWSLWPSKDVFLSSLMKHKSMNRMSYVDAWQNAVDNGCDDALLQDFDGNILESSFASLLFKKGESFIEPQTEFKLPGTAQEIAAKMFPIKAHPISLDSIKDFDNVYALNSLGGMIPVSAIGKTEFECDHELAEKVSREILNLA